MPESPDLQDLARRYLDLWQQQLGGLAEDEEAAEVMAQTMALMNAGAAAFAAMAGAVPPQPGSEDRRDDDSAFPASGGKATDPVGSPAAAASYGDPDHDVAELTRRLERLEKRIAALEAGAEDDG